MLQIATTLRGTLQIPESYTKLPQQTPTNTIGNKHTKWNKTTHLPILQQNILTLPPLPNYIHIRLLKYLPQYSYYIDGSFKPPKEIRPQIWKEERARYNIYNPYNNKIIRKERFRGLQTY